jgi:2-C-methyl-D-erythritol 4-phosphate cytidylyltransferase / 2-C-methyl-D-erythritol 2,4-cyclodiphosphate synthase
VTTVALIVAAGRGARFGSGIPKQYVALGGQPLLRHCVANLAGHPAIAGVRVVFDPSAAAHYGAAVDGLPVMAPVPGGASRQESVRLGLESLADHAPDKVLIHDGARPFCEPALVDRVLEGLTTRDGAIAALPVVDTLKRADDRNGVTATLDRTGVWRAQTPQGFLFGPILAAHRAAAGRTDLTDDAAVAELAGLDIALVLGAEDNLKVTTPDDLERAEAILARRHGDVRVGSGFDVHRFGDGDKVILCGLEIPHDQALVGDSDADVALHALVDAILGGLGAGDIGRYFPPGDPQWRDLASEVFVRDAVARVNHRGGVIAHADITIICEAPKIAPHADAMQARVASMLGIDVSRVGVKATTTEGLGFTGRREGIAAQATVTLRLPS